MKTPFILDASLEKDSVFILDLKLSQLRIINNHDYPWVILVPRISGVAEVTDLGKEEYKSLSEEIYFVAGALQSAFAPDKLNIATIGNVVRQMHVHIVARYKNDELFPKPVWGCKFSKYPPEKLNSTIAQISSAVKKQLGQLSWK